MEQGTAISWFLALAPLSISPGPANVMFAASGDAFGIRATVPFWLGTNLVCTLQSLAVGLGFMAIIGRFPESALVMKYVGVAFLLYLAFRLVRSAISKNEITKPLGFKEGVIVQLLNAKFLLIPMIMFSQFYIPAEHGTAGLTVLVFALMVLTMLSNLTWVLGGSALTAILAKEGVAKNQGYFFGGILFATALWLAL